MDDATTDEVRKSRREGRTKIKKDRTKVRKEENRPLVYVVNPDVTSLMRLAR